MKHSENRHAVPSASGRPSGSPARFVSDPLFRAPDPARVGGASVTFEPGARTAWHTHPLGQTLIVTLRLRTRSALGWADRGNPSR